MPGPPEAGGKGGLKRRGLLWHFPGTNSGASDPKGLYPPTARGQIIKVTHPVQLGPGQSQQYA